jgi:ribosomal protein L18
METRKKNKHVEVQFISDQDVGREIISITDTKIKKIGNNVNTNFSHAYVLILNSSEMACKQ